MNHFNVVPNGLSLHLTVFRLSFFERARNGCEWWGQWLHYYHVVHCVVNSELYIINFFYQFIYTLCISLLRVYLFVNLCVYERYAGNPGLKVGNASTIISNSPSSSSKQNVGVIIGSVVGGIAALAILIYLMIHFIFYHPRKRDVSGPHPSIGEVPMPSIPKGGK